MGLGTAGLMGNKTFRPQDVSPLVVSPLAVSPLFSTLVVSPPITISPLVVSLPNIFHYLIFIQFLMKLAIFLVFVILVTFNAA